MPVHVFVQGAVSRVDAVSLALQPSTLFNLIPNVERNKHLLMGSQSLDDEMPLWLELDFQMEEYRMRVP